MSILSTFETNPKSQFEQLFNDASIGIVIVDQKGMIINGNNFFLSMFGYEADEIKNKPIEFIIPSRYHHNHVANRENFYKNPVSRPMGLGKSLFGKKKDGSEFPVEISLDAHVYGTEKYIVACITNASNKEVDLGNLENIKESLDFAVENKNKELSRTLQVLELLNEKLEDAYDNQKAILDNAKVMMFSMYENGLFKFFNPETVKLTGYSESEVISKKDPLLFIRKKEIQLCKEEFENKHNLFFNNDFEVLKEKSIRNEIVDLECFFVHKNGNEFPVALSITPIYNKKKLITGFMGVAMDLTIRKEAQNNLLEALSKERKLGELKSRFVSMASHEFRTPLSTILSSAYLIEQYAEKDDQPKREKHLNRIVSAVNNLTNILNEFLSVGKIEEGKIATHLTECSINDFLTALLKEIKHSLKKGQYLNLTHQGNEKVITDQNLLKNIMLNLISNAIKFSAEESKIDIKTNIDAHYFTVEVRDYGIGISEEDQGHLMERFFRGSNVTNIQGTGLGLHIVSKYVETLGGKLTFKSNLEQGTSIQIIFNHLKLKEHEDNIIN